MYKALKIVNTYVWIIDTLNSRINNKIWIIIIIIVIKIGLIADCLNRVNNKWPAIILAVKRIASVHGRIKFLIVSINTINGIRKEGVPWGIIWLNIWFILLNHRNINNENHIGNDIDIAKIKCLELVKIYGNNPIKLLIKINKNIEIKYNRFNELNLLGKIIFNSLFKIIIKFKVIRVNRELKNQNG